MPDMASISVVLSSIKTAADNAKLLRETDVSVKKAETKLKLAELVRALADAKLELAEVQNILLDKDKKTMTLEETLLTRKMLYGNRPGTGAWTRGRRMVRFANGAMTRNSSLLCCKITEMGTGGV